MSHDPPGTSTDFAIYLEEHLTRRDWKATDLAAHAGLASSVVFRWRHGYQPNVDNARALAGALGVPLLEILIKAGQLTPEEAHATVNVPQPLTDVPSDEMLRELLRRAERDGAHNVSS